MGLELNFGLAAKCCMCTSNVRAIVCAFMFCDMFITFRRRHETLIEPFTIQARTFENVSAVKAFDVVLRRGFHRQSLNGKSHFARMLYSFEASKHVESRRSDVTRPFADAIVRSNWTLCASSSPGMCLAALTITFDALDFFLGAFQ